MVDRKILALAVLVSAVLVAAVYTQNPLLATYLGIGFGTAIVAIERNPYYKGIFDYNFNLGYTMAKRRGAMDPKVGLGLAATFITAFIAIMIVAIIEPETSANIQANSTLYQPYQDFVAYSGKSFKMWGLAIFIGVLGLVLGAIFGFWRS